LISQYDLPVSISTVGALKLSLTLDSFTAFSYVRCRISTASCSGRWWINIFFPKLRLPVTVRQRQLPSPTVPDDQTCVLSSDPSLGCTTYAAWTLGRSRQRGQCHCIRLLDGSYAAIPFSLMFTFKEEIKTFNCGVSTAQGVVGRRAMHDVGLSGHPVYDLQAR
jgi:hypothetical protein